jgi:hypothetical protein
MSESPEVDFSQIRGDWHFHINYVANAVHQTLARAVKMWGGVQAEANDPAIGELVAKLEDTWGRLEQTATGEDKMDTTSPILDEWLAVCDQIKAPCDGMEEAKGLGGSGAISDLPLEQFTEAMRQVRSFNEDLIMMREQKP